ncbi:MAG: hypothetical protein U9Q90_01650 [Campylobacterota bacterium]|nr:hypothetical protein [Campylobacterota bacterium]
MKNYLLSLILIFALFSAELFAYDPASTQMHVKDLEIEDVEQFPFIGITGSYSDPLEEKGVFGVRAGMQNNVWRTIFTYEDNFGDYQAFLVEVDRTLVAGLFGNRGRIYLGASGGWLRYNADLPDQPEDGNGTIAVVIPSDIDDPDLLQTSDGYSYGINIGFMYYLSEQADLSIGYRYLFVNDINKFDYIQGPDISLHYFF